MAEGKKSFILYADLHSTVQFLPDDKAGKLLKTILSYVNDENPEITDLLVKIAFEPIKLQLKRDLKKWDEFKVKQSENGKLGGRPKKESQENPKNPSLLEKSQKSLNVTVNVNDTVKNNNTVDERYQKLYEMFYRVSKWDANKISEQVGKFINKYPEVPLNQSGPLVNTWVANYREVSTTKKLVL
jgi:vacuolar-type H+-ATPase subunit I/STV1